MDKKIKETLKKAQDWELEIWSEESGYDYVEIFLDDVVDIIDSIKYLKQQNKRYREAIEFGIEYLKNSDIRQVQLVVTALKSALEESE